MSVTMGDAILYLSANPDALKADLKKADSTIKTFGNQAAGFLGSVMKAGMMAAAAGVAAGVAGIGAALKLAQGAARIEELDIVLGLVGEKAGWTTTQIKENVEAMKELGIRGDIARETLSQFARYQLDAADASTVARVAQDAAVLSGQDSSEVLDSIINGVLTQNSLVLRNAGLNIIASDAMDTYAKSIRTTTAKLDSQQRIQAMINAVQEEGLNITGAYDAAMGSAGKQLRSLPRYFYEVGVSIGEAFLPAFADVIFGVKDWIKDIRGMIEEGEPLYEFFQRLGEKLSSAFGWILEKVDKVMVVFKYFLWQLGQGKTPIEAIKGVLRALVPPELREKLEGAIVTIENLWASIESLGEFLVDVFTGGEDPVGALANAFWYFANALGASEETAGKVFDAIRKVGDFIAENITPIVAGLTAMGTAVLIGLVPAFIAWATAAAAAAIATLAAIAPLLLIGAAVAALVYVWQNDFGGIQGIVENLGIILSHFGTMAVEKVFKPIGDAIGKVIEWVEEFIKKLKNIKLPDWLTPGSPTPFEKGLRGISKAFEKELSPQLGKFSAQLQATGGAGLGAQTTSYDQSRTTRVDQMNINNGRDEQGVMQVLRNASRI